MVLFVLGTPKHKEIHTNIINPFSMVFNPNGTEPTFLKFDSWSPGAGFIPIINSNVLN